MLHADLLGELLDGEISVATRRLAGRCELWRHGPCVHAVATSGAIIRLDGERYDAEPFAVAVVGDDHAVVPHEQWPPGLSLGAHPILGRPFACIRGTAEYHVHPSHLDDRWDLHRGHIQLVDLVGHLLTKAGM